MNRLPKTPSQGLFPVALPFAARGGSETAS